MKLTYTQNKTHVSLSLDNNQFPYQLFGIGALELGQQHTSPETFFAQSQQCLQRASGLVYVCSA